MWILLCINYNIVVNHHLLISNMKMHCCVTVNKTISSMNKRSSSLRE